MDEKKIEKQLLDFADRLGGGELLNELMSTRLTNLTLKQSTSKTTIFDPNHFRLDSELIRVRLKECNLTLKQLHEQVNVSYRTVMRWLTNEEFPKDKNLMQLAEVLQLDPHQLLVSKSPFRKGDTLNENIRFAQRSIESLVTEILKDEKMPKEKKIDALIKYHNALIKLKSS